MKNAFLIATACIVGLTTQGLTSCVTTTTTAPDGTVTTVKSIDAGSFAIGADVIKGFVPARGTVQVVPEK